MGFLLYFVMAFGSYLVFTAGSGAELLFWPPEEIVVGAVTALIFSVAAYKTIPRTITYKAFNPVKWILGLIFIAGPFLVTVIMANIEVLYRIATGRIRPAIVKVSTGMKNEAGIFLLANTISLSPGTLTVDISPEEDELYIHCLNWKKKPGEKAEPADVGGILHAYCKAVFK